MSRARMSVVLTINDSVATYATRAVLSASFDGMDQAIVSAHAMRQLNVGIGNLSKIGYSRRQEQEITQVGHGILKGFHHSRRLVKKRSPEQATLVWIGRVTEVNPTQNAFRAE